MRLGDRGDDREAEADAAARPGSRGVGAVEALEDVLRDAPRRGPGRSRRPRSRPCRSARVTETETGVPGGVWARTFASRLSTIWRSRSRSPTTTALSAWSSIGPFGSTACAVSTASPTTSSSSTALALERPAVVEAREEQQVVDEHAHRSDSRLMPLIERSRSSGRSAAPRSNSSAYARTAASGVRSSCEASATNRRSLRSDASCARNAASIWREHRVERRARGGRPRFAPRRARPAGEVAGRDRRCGPADLLERPQTEPHEPEAERRRSHRARRAVTTSSIRSSRSSVESTSASDVATTSIAGRASSIDARTR